MKTFNKMFGLSLVALLAATLLPILGQAQSRQTFTTLSAAVAGVGSKYATFNLTSATGVAVGQIGYVDREAVQITSLTGTIIGVNRGQYNTKQTTHNSGATFFFGSNTGGQASNSVAFYDTQTAYEGSCTASNYAYLPHIVFTTGQIQDCLNSVWVTGSGGATAPSASAFVLSPVPGAVAYTGINTNGTAVGATTMYCTEVNMPYNKVLTGIKVLNGTTVGTDLGYVILYGPGGGTKLATSALAGAVTASASDYQSFAFTTPFFAVGPSDYFACIQHNTGTDTVRMAITGTNDLVLTKGQTGATFGTVPSLTAPTSFTTAVGPYIALY